MGRGNATRVVLVEDHDAVREATEIMLRLAGFAVVEGTSDPTRAREIVRTERPDVAVIDLRLGTQSGARLAHLLAREHPELRLVIFTAVDDPAELRDALSAPAHALVCKTGSLKKLFAAIRAVDAGERCVPPELERDIALAPARRLSSREREVLELLADGLSAEAIAPLLHVTPATVRTHIRNAVAHLGASGRTHAVAVALRTGEF